MFSKKNSRRQFIKLASGLLAAPMLSVSSMGARAQSAGKSPLRFLTVIDSYGLPTATRNDIWIRSTAGDYALTNNDLGTILQPLSSYRNNMLVVSGINLESMTRAGDSRTHERIACHTLTGSCVSNDGGARPGPSAEIQHASLDVHIANYLNQPGNLPSSRIYPHLFFSDYAEAAKTTYCYNESGKQIRSIAGANAAASSLFNDLSNSGPGPVETADLLAQRELLAMISSQVQGLKVQLGNESYHTGLDAYSASVNDLAAELELRSSSTCQIPSGFDSLSGAGRNPAQSARGDILKVIGQAFACDMTTSATYMIGGETINQHSHSFLSDGGDAGLRSLLNSNLHSSSHLASDAANKSHELTRIHQAEMLADLMDTMSSTIDVDGNTVLDNTVVFWTSAMSNNTHRIEDYPYLLIAGKNTNLNGGYHYDCEGSTDNDLLTTIGQGLNVPINSFGGYNKSGNIISSLNNGPISKLLKTTL